jgi:hypothetical protein
MSRVNWLPTDGCGVVGRRDGMLLQASERGRYGRIGFDGRACEEQQQ